MVVLCKDVAALSWYVSFNCGIDEFEAYVDVVRNCVSRLGD
jgi:hypothetical protein